MNNLPGIGDPYWYEWFVGVKNVIKMLNPDNGIEYVVFQSSDYEAIDDVVVGKKENIELCYQVKHVRKEKNLTFSSLIDKDEESKKSLLTSIAEGWEKTSKINIIPILYSNKAIGIRRSTRTSKITQNKYKCLSLKDFFMKVKELVDGVEKWEDIVINEINFQEQWTEFVGQLKINDKLTFLKKLKLELNQNSLEESEKEIINEIQKIFKCNDIISYKIFNTIISQLRIWVTTRRKKEKITREQVLELLSNTNEKNTRRFILQFPFLKLEKSFVRNCIKR